MARDPFALRVLLVEDNPADGNAIMRALLGSSTSRFEMQVVADLASARPLLKEGAWDAVLLDLSLPDSWGMAALRQVAEALPATPIVVLAYLDERVLEAQALRQGAQDYLVKGSNLADLGRSIRKAIERKAFDAARARRVISNFAP